VYLQKENSNIFKLKERKKKVVCIGKTTTATTATAITTINKGNG